MPEESGFQAFTAEDFEALSSKGAGQGAGAVSPPPPEPSGDFALIEFEEEALISEDLEGGETQAEEERTKLAETFSSESFVREDSLLTNAEAYAASIRDEADTYRQGLVGKTEDLNREAERIRKEAEHLKTRAEEERSSAIQAAESEVQSIRDAAYQEGFESGLEQGTQQRYAETEVLGLQVVEVIEQLRTLRQTVRQQGEEELVRLTQNLTRQVVMEELAVNPKVIENLARSALKEVEEHGKIHLYLHPQDYEFLLNSETDLERYLGEEQTLTIRASLDATPGSILVEGDETSVEFTFQNQLERLDHMLVEHLSEQHARMHEVEMDAYDFTPRSADAQTPAEAPSSSPAATESSTEADSATSVPEAESSTPA